MRIRLRRREFIAALGGVAASPLAAHAQQAAMPTIGFLNIASPDLYEKRLRGFHRGLKEAGYVDGENVTILYRWAENQMGRAPELVADLVRRRVSVIVTSTSVESASAAKTATTAIPIVFLVSQDPVKLGLVASLARPGGNLTGVNFYNAELNAKRLQLLYELVPGARRVGALLNPANAVNAQTILSEVETAARALRLQIQVLNAATISEIDTVFEILKRERPDALFVSGDPLFNNRRLQLGLLAARNEIPASYSSRDYPEYGGLMSYGADVTDAFRQVGDYVGRIIKGAKPTDLPVVQASKFELVINSQAARLLGLNMPPMLLARADEVIE